MHICHKKKDRTGRDASEYLLCPRCFFRKVDDAEYWAKRSIEDDYELAPMDDGYWCSACHSFIEPPPAWEPYRSRHRRSPWGWGKSKYKPCTRRRAASGKLIGGVHGHAFGWSEGTGKYTKRQLHKAYRRYYNRMAAATLREETDADITIPLGSIPHWRGEVSWKCW